MNAALPISPFRGRILAELERAGVLILAAPTGSGKSTQTPQFLRGKVRGRILVLEPRRLSARSLAARVARESGAELGGDVGYQVRFESRFGPSTKVLFQTYGIFVQRLPGDPALDGVGAVLLDEFHERTLDCDLALAWLKALRRTRPELKVAVMSATLEGAPLESYLPGAARVTVPGRLHPVEVRHFPPSSREALEDAALRAFKELARSGLDGSVLVFMPGLREIRRTLERFGPACRELGLELKPLHGSMELGEQNEILEPSASKRVIVATNVAETGLTVPGVTAVIDGGLHRVAGFDAARGINTLYLARVSKANAAQRAGRAGRTAPGRCLRLWSAADELGMAESLKPEISRLELNSLFLSAASLPEAVGWLSPPNAKAWAEAERVLRSLSALDAAGHASERGRRLLAFPDDPKIAAVLEDARALGPEAFERACAMAAVFETAGEPRPGASPDLAVLARDLLSGAGEFPRETSEAFRQLKRSAAADPKGAAAKGALEKIWLAAFAERLAGREGEGRYFKLADGRGALLSGEGRPPELILALDLRERAGGTLGRQVSVALCLAMDPEALRRWFPEECVWEKASAFDARKNRVVREERLMFRGLVLERREPRQDDRKASSDIWAEKFATGELAHPGMDEKARQLVVRVGLMRRFYPDMGYPELATDDWRLIYGEACAGKNALKDIERVSLLPHIEGYVGPARVAFMDKRLPTSLRLPSGKLGRYTYFESQPAELQARLGDFIRMSGTLSLCDDRLPVAFDVLAPNYRTVQKTQDLSSFWKNTYPAVKRELQRRYPKHPWP